MKRIVVLGAGMIGRSIAMDLAEKHYVTSADLDKKALEQLPDKPNIKTKILDVTDKAALSYAISECDIVISAVPGFLGLQTMIHVINQKKDLVDISFMPEDVLYLDSLAKENNVTVVMDCGIAPGMPNYIIGYHSRLMKIDDVQCLVGGLPKARIFPFEYKAPFSPRDVIEEYIRPARYVENGNLIVRPALTDPEFVTFDNIGTLEAFNTDGLRSLISTMKQIPNMKEKTLRYPGHIHLIKALKAAGFFDREPVDVNEAPVTPFDFTSKILFNVWKPGTEEPEYTVMRITIKGSENGFGKEIIYDLYDEYDEAEKLSSMARTTGFTATGTAEMILKKVYTDKGVFPPELVGQNAECFKFILEYLHARNVRFTLTERNI